MSNCIKLPYFEGLTDETIKQGSDFDLTEGVTAYDGNDEEIGYSTSPTNAEFDTCDVGSHVIQYHAGQPVDRFLPNICLGTDLAVSIPSYCDNYQSVTKERLIRIIQAANPTIYGIPHVTIAQNTPFDPLNGVSAVDDNGNPITDIEYSGYLDKRVTGNPITITDGQSVVPVKSLEVELEPIQDLHGYDKPWAGGAGKNKFDKDSLDSVSDYVEYYNSYHYSAPIILKPNTAYVMSPTSTASLGVSDYYVLYINSDASDPNYIGGGGEVFRYPVNGGTPVQVEFTTGATGAIRFGVIAGNPATSPKATALEAFMTINYQVEEGTTATAWTPYSNICPIEGWTDVDTHITGINVWDEDWEVGSINSSTGDNSSTTTQIRSKNYIPCKPSTAYYFQSPMTSNDVRIAYYRADKSFRSMSAWLYNGVFTTPSDCEYIRFYTATAYGTTYNNDISINYPSTDTDYHAYQGTTYATDLGQTVYGGTLDVVSGELVVDRAMVDLGTLGFSYDSSGKRWQVAMSDIYNYPSRNGNLVAEKYVADITASAGDEGKMFTVGKALYIYSTDGVTPPSGNLVYPLATPQTIQLTPQQVMLLTGDNNLWSDGTITMVYSAEVPTEGDITYPLEGEYTLTYRVTDKCGNVGEATRQITVVANEVQSVQNIESEVSE